MRTRRHLLPRLAGGLALLLAVAACEEHTVSIRFEPEVGDRYRFRSDVETSVTRTIGEDVETVEDTSVLQASETVIDLEDEEVLVEVTLERDGAAPRTYEVRFDRADRLTAIDLVEGVPASALGLDLDTDLPADIASPPSGPIEPGTRWFIDRAVRLGGRGEPSSVTGTGRIESLGIEDGHEVARAVVVIDVPVRSVIETKEGRVTLIGDQRSESRTTYDLADGAARRDRTEIRGTLDVIVEPPAEITAPPVEGAISYTIRTETRRVATGTR